MRHRFKILVGQDRTGNCRDLNTTKSPPRSDRRAGSWDAPGVADAWSLPSRFDLGLELWETGGWRYTFQCAMSFGCFWSGFTIGTHLMQFLVVLLFLVFEFLFAFVVVVAAATVGSGILFIVFWFLAMVVFCGVFFFSHLWCSQNNSLHPVLRGMGIDDAGFSTTFWNIFKCSSIMF